MLNKKFTLTELIISVIVISILAVIVIANIGNWKDESVKSAIAGNIKVIQTASDRHAINENNDSIGIAVSTKGKPQFVDFGKITPKYIKKDPKVGKYWVDYNGTIWGSITSPPSVEKAGDTYTITNNKRTISNNVYVIEKNTYKKVNKKPITDNNFEGEPGKEYLFSAVDELDHETAPVELNYIGSDSGNPNANVCTLKTEEAKYIPNRSAANKIVYRANYDHIIMDNAGNYVAMATEPIFPYKNSSGMALVVDKYDKDLGLLDTITLSEDGNWDEALDIITDKNGNYYISGYLNQEALSKQNPNAKKKKIPVSDEQRDSFSDYSERIIGIKLTKDLELDTFITMDMPGDIYNSMISDNQGNIILVQRIDNTNYETNLIKLDDKLNVSLYKTFSNSDIGKANSPVDDIIPAIYMSNGDLYLRSTVDYSHSQIMTFDSNFEYKDSYVFKEGSSESYLGNIVEGDNGSIIALGYANENYRTAVPTLFKLDSNLNEVQSKTFSEESYDDRGGVLFKEVNNITAKVNGSFQTFDFDLNLIKEESHMYQDDYVVQGFDNIQRNRIIKDQDTYIFNFWGIVKVQDLESITKNEWLDEPFYEEENVPRIFHTKPPLKQFILNHDESPLPDNEEKTPNAGDPDLLFPSYIAGYNFNNNSVDPIYANSLLFTDDEDNVYIVETNGSLTSYTRDNIPDDILNGTVASYYFDMGMDKIILDMGNPPANAPVYIEKAYRAGYNAENNSVNPIYANSGFVSGETMFVVESNGTLTPYPFENLPETIISNLVAGYFFDINSDKLILQMGVAPANAPIYDKGSPTGPIEETKGEKVDPCYAGSHIIKISDLMMYKVQDDGSLVLIGNPATKTNEELGYDIYNDSLFYLYSDGVIVDFPPVKNNNIT